jgi:predicted Ser/Thr protein kinase
VTRDEWERLKALFIGALDRPAATRDGWVKEHAAGDDLLAHEAAALLHAHETAEGFLETPPVIDPEDVAAADAAEITTTGAEAAGTRLGPYVIEYRADHGGQGVVYCARDTRLDRRVALKALRAFDAGNPALRERLRREARVAATVVHPAVATVYALEEIDGRLFIASEFIDGQTLRQAIERGPLEPARALSIAADISDALEKAHAAGCVHRDLKPENVMIANGGAVKVVDFGIARIEGIATRLTQTGAALGTPAYMPPEQLIHGTTDVRSDIYAVGVLLTEMLTGQHPLARGRRPIPAVAAEVVSRCLQLDPADRYQTAHDLKVALQQALEQTTRVTAGAEPAAQTRTSSLWWWQFHQAAVSVVYAAMLWPAWLARGSIGGTAGNALFVAVLTAAIVAITLRLHLWFTSRFYPAELDWARERARRWVTSADLMLSAGLILAGGLLGDTRPTLAVLQIAVGIGTASASLLVEPATTRAAFGSSGGL